MLPPPRCRLARLFSIQGWRFSSQSSMASISLPVTGPRSSTAPRLVDAVSGDSARAVASLEAGSTMRATMAATARSRMRSALRPRMRTSPRDRSVPSTAATCPWGTALLMAKTSLRFLTATPPLRRVSIPLMMCSGMPVRVGAGTFFDAFAFSPGLADEDCGLCAPVRDAFDVDGHGNNYGGMYCVMSTGKVTIS